jgi:translation initiation factor IF-2
MTKIRINELARQLEVPSHAIIDMLPELGVSEKKTHSSSIDEPVALIIRERLQGGGGDAARRESHSSVAVAEPEASGGAHVARARDAARAGRS